MIYRKICVKIETEKEQLERIQRIKHAFSYRKGIMRKKKGFFSISAVAKMFSVHQQTIRLYEKQGLISPKRSDGNTRLFSENDIDRLEEIIYLTHQFGINLAGVEMIFRLKDQIKKLQKEMNDAFKKTQNELNEQADNSKKIVTSTVRQLLAIKNEHNSTMVAPLNNEAKDNHSDDIENWKIEYDRE